jgi:hypothetical protein
MYKPTLLLAAFAALTSAAAVPGPAPTSAPRLVKRGADHISSICEASTKTLFGPYTLKYPIAGLDQSDVFYAIELPDGTIELSVHGSHDLPLSGHDEDGIIVDFPGGKGGKVGGEGMFLFWGEMIEECDDVLTCLDSASNGGYWGEDLYFEFWRGRRMGNVSFF